MYSVLKFKFINVQIMLSILEALGTEAVIFENLKQTSERMNNLEDLDKDRWATVAYLCDKVKSLEQRIKNVERENEDLLQLNNKLTIQNNKLSEKFVQISEMKKEMIRLMKHQDLKLRFPNSNYSSMWYT